MLAFKLGTLCLLGHDEKLIPRHLVADDDRFFLPPGR